jgi:hypothetical protein
MRFCFGHNKRKRARRYCEAAARDDPQGAIAAQTLSFASAPVSIVGGSDQSSIEKIDRFGFVLPKLDFLLLVENSRSCNQVALRRAKSKARIANLRRESAQRS